MNNANRVKVSAYAHGSVNEKKQDLSLMYKRVEEMYKRVGEMTKSSLVTIDMKVEMVSFEEALRTLSEDTELEAPRRKCSAMQMHRS